VNGDDSAISASARRGFALFNGRAMCSKCHGGWRFTDDGFHDVGVASSDRGRGAILPALDVNAPSAACPAEAAAIFAIVLSVALASPARPRRPARG